MNKKPGLFEYYEMHQETFLLIAGFFIITVLALLMIIVFRERKNKKKTVRAEKMLRSILNSITEAVFIIKPDGTLIDANTEAKNRINITDCKKDVINIMDFFPEEVTKKRLEYIRLVVETKMPVSFTDERNGLILLNNIYPIVNESGMVDMLSIESSDITFIKRNEELFNNIITNAPMGVIYLTTNGNIILANHIAESMLYLSKNSVTGYYEKYKETATIPFISGHTPGWPLTMVIETGKPLYNAECMIEREGNYKQYISINAAPIKDFHEKITGIVVMIVDVTDTTLMRIELSDSQKKLSDILESINDGFFAISKDGILTYVNSQAEEIWGLNAEKIVGKSIERVFKRKNFQSIYEHYDLVIQTNKFSQLEYYEGTSQKWFLLHYYPYADGISIYFTDITYRKELEFKLKEMANIDALTGILSRRAGILILEKTILTSIRDNRPLAICFIDVDGLKRVNDTYGHSEGDRLLIDISKIISSVFRDSDTFFRLGGDEFLAILPGCGINQTGIIKERIQLYLKIANDSGNHEYPLEVSSGFTVYPPDQKLSADELIALADSEMYREKQNKKAHRV